jgi:hypothetical protein
MTKEYDVIGSKGDTYKIKFEENNWTCTCKAFTYSKEIPQTCKHIKKIQTENEPVKTNI